MTVEQIIKSLESRIAQHQNIIDQHRRHIVRNIDFSNIVEESLKRILQLEIEKYLMKEILKEIN